MRFVFDFSVSVMLEGAAFTSEIQIPWMYYNYFVYIVLEWIKGGFSVCRPCTKEDFMLMALDLPCVAAIVLLSGVAYGKSWFLCR